MFKFSFSAENYLLVGTFLYYFQAWILILSFFTASGCLFFLISNGERFLEITFRGVHLNVENKCSTEKMTHSMKYWHFHSKYEKMIFSSLCYQILPQNCFLQCNLKLNLHWSSSMLNPINLFHHFECKPFFGILRKKAQISLTV